LLYHQRGLSPLLYQPSKGDKKLKSLAKKVAKYISPTTNLISPTKNVAKYHQRKKWQKGSFNVKFFCSIILNVIILMVHSWLNKFLSWSLLGTTTPTTTTNKQHMVACVNDVIFIFSSNTMSFSFFHSFILSSFWWFIHG
jgi:hypothetical protein